jgi:hypothetical protein
LKFVAFLATSCAQLQVDPVTKMINFRTNLALSLSTAGFDREFVLLLATSQPHLQERNSIH